MTLHINFFTCSKIFIEESIRKSEAQKPHKEKEQINPSNVHKKLHSNKDQHARPPLPPNNQLTSNKSTFVLNQENIKPPKTEQQASHKVSVPDIVLGPKQTEVWSVPKKDKSKSENIVSRAKEIRIHFNQTERESSFINIENFKRNKLKYVPHIQIKDSRFGNSLVPVLPSFLIRDN